MDSWLYYIKMGLEHITDINGYDHILFIVALAVSKSVLEWRKLLLLVTAFTIGHSIALAIATFELVPVDSAITEHLIPITIILTCMWNIFYYRNTPDKKQHDLQIKKEFILIISFGLIHGLGFSNYLKSMITSTESIAETILLFNLGLETGQIIILAIVLMINFMVIRQTKISQSVWSSIISSLIILISLPILWNTGQALFYP
jgi:hypothetical protein